LEEQLGEAEEEVARYLNTERPALKAELATAKARVARLEGLLQKLVASVERCWRQRTYGLDGALIDAKAALSTAPQVSTEQASPSPAVGKQPIERFTFAGPMGPNGSETVIEQEPAQPAPGGTELATWCVCGEEPMTPAEMFGGCFHDMKSQPAPSPAVGNPHSGSSFESAFTAEELAEIRPAQPATGRTERCEWHPSGACSRCGRTMGRAENGVRECDGGYPLRASDTTPAEPPSVDYVTYEVLIEALRTSQYYGLADRLEKARGR
jgi:hypothetical protein